MWKLTIALIEGDILAQYKAAIVPHKDEFINIKGVIYKVRSVCYSYVINHISVLVDE